jgi:hypothetical protein
MTRVEVKCSPVKGLTMRGRNIRFPGHLSMGHLAQAVRKRCRKLEGDQAIYLFVDGRHLVPMSRRVDQVATDGVLMIDVLLESTFGGL